ncbi:thermonuclease family protein [Heliorestis convoluta]|uniref:Thermonuclease family protein n=1 Tax=Heliorestis convoluta TaxID=356322 RepID=A0A5Q2N3P0_9FIRM|nr:thermonuclease family protein [Heliorestis convoluta]QGG48499.1 thermonuclease family protein [Heliorestis convoluta]
MKKHPIYVALITALLLLFLTGCMNKTVFMGDTVIVVREVPEQTVTVQVVRVVDGDTAVILIDGKQERLRFIGIDTPETVHPTIGEEPYGREASDYTKQRLEGRTFQLEFDVQERDRYGRLLGYIWLEEELFNETLVRNGFAEVTTFPPNVKYVDIFKAAQEEARKEKRGIWGL